MKRQAVHFWEDLLPLLQPTHIITAEKVAERVLELADRAERYRRPSLRLPSLQAMSRISGMFHVDDRLLARYPEVNRVVQRNKVFFVCHAVSLYGR